MNRRETIRYRTEAFSGQQYRDAAEVMAFETFEMGNVDMLETLSKGVLKDSVVLQQCANFINEIDRNGFVDDFSPEDGVEFFKKVLSEIQRVTGHDIKYALWLADLDTVKSFYGQDMASEDDYDAYEVGQVVLSDLGSDGTLYGYANFPRPISLEEKTYFHVTLMDNVPSILEHGLVPQIGERAADLGESEPAVYLFPSEEDLNNALYNWLGEWYNDNYGEDCELAILHVRLNENTPVFQTEAEYERICKVVIPAEVITFYNELGEELKDVKPGLFGHLINLKEEEKMSYWSEIRNDYFEALTSPKDGEALASISIDAWASENDNESGDVIARVLLSQHGDVLVDYHDSIARTDQMAQEAIGEAMAHLREYFQEYTRSNAPDKQEEYKSPLDLFIEAEVPFRMNDLHDVPLTQTIKEALIQYVQDRSDIMFDHDGFDDRLLAKYDELVHESVQSYEGAIAFLCASLNKREGNEYNRKVEDFTPIFESSNYFGIYFYNGDNEYYLVSKEQGEHDLVLDDSPDFIGKNNLSLLTGEKILDVANKEFLGYLVEYSREHAKGLLPERELAGLHVLELALKPGDIETIFEDVKRQLESEEVTTEYGEPQAWVYLENGRSIEVTLEKEMLAPEDYYYSSRLHCTEEENDNNDYVSTVGIINSLASASANVDEIKDLLIANLKCNERYPVAAHSQKESTPQSLADKIAAAESKRTANARDAKEKPEKGDSGRL